MAETLLIRASSYKQTGLVGNKKFTGFTQQNVLLGRNNVLEKLNLNNFYTLNLPQWNIETNDAFLQYVVNYNKSIFLIISKFGSLESSLSAELKCNNEPTVLSYELYLMLVCSGKYKVIPSNEIHIDGYYFFQLVPGIIDSLTQTFITELNKIFKSCVQSGGYIVYKGRRRRVHVFKVGRRKVKMVKVLGVMEPVN